MKKKQEKKKKRPFLNWLKWIKQRNKMDKTNHSTTTTKQHDNNDDESIKIWSMIKFHQMQMSIVYSGNGLSIKANTEINKTTKKTLMIR